MGVESEPLFDKPKRKRRTGPTIPPLKIEELDEPKYKATDNDLPLIFWPEPTFDEEP